MTTCSPLEAPDKLTALKAFNDRAKNGELEDKILTFCPPENDERDRKRTEINSTTDKYLKQVTQGAVDRAPLLTR